jgi:hypothetical protein
MPMVRWFCIGAKKNGCITAAVVADTIKGCNYFNKSTSLACPCYKIESIVSRKN